MSKGAYIGVAGKARNIKAIYVGDESGKARKVKKGYVGVGGKARLFYTAATPASELDIGSEVMLNVGGVPTAFLIVHQGLPSGAYDASCNGTWLLMKDCIKESNSSSYGSSNIIHTYLNDVFLHLLDAEIQSAVKEVKIPLSSSSNPLATRVFIPSSTELGFTAYTTSDGDALHYFSGGGSRVAFMNGKAVEWWTRSRYNAGSGLLASVESTGGLRSRPDGMYGLGVRPMLILPSDFEFDGV